MTPQELAVLFSGHIAAFFLIWFTSIAERVIARAGQPPENEGTIHHGAKDESLAGGDTWNVRTFFVMKKSLE